MPLELEGELLNGSTDMQHKQRGGEGGERRALIQELPFLRNACTAGSKYFYLNVHPQECISGSTPTTLLQPWVTHRQARTGAPLQCRCCSEWMRMVRLGLRRLWPDLHFTRTRELLHCPQAEGMGSCPSSVRDWGWLPLGLGQGEAGRRNQQFSWLHEVAAIGVVT